jgi:long-chain fatty acid transport protein
MRKSILLALVVLLSVPMAFPSIVTNTNQSIGFYRLLARFASVDVDAVYYNPAGLTKLQDGFHLALHNQTITQDKTIVNNFPYLNNGGKYVGEVRVPFFPTFYAVYKKGPLALSFGFNPIGGGGSANFKTGLPSFEVSLSTLPLLLSSMGLTTTKYNADIAFEGSSIYLGFQANASYAINEMVSVAVGLRYVSAKNIYTGSIENVAVNPYFPAYGLTGQMIPAGQLFSMLGQPAYAAMVANKAVDVTQTGSGITPIFSVMVSPFEGLNLSARYEMNTKLELTNATTKDDTKGVFSADGLFPDGAKTHADIPGTLALGASYAVMSNLRAYASLNTDFDKSANWDGREAFVSKNTLEYAFGLEYDLFKTLTISAGYLHSGYNVLSAYQSDMDFLLSADTFGAGVKWRLMDNLSVEGGVITVNYKDTYKPITYYSTTGLPFGVYNENYSQTTLGFGFGVNYSFR